MRKFKKTLAALLCATMCLTTFTPALAESNIDLTQDTKQEIDITQTDITQTQSDKENIMYDQNSSLKMRELQTTRLYIAFLQRIHQMMKRCLPLPIRCLKK